MKHLSKRITGDASPGEVERIRNALLLFRESYLRAETQPRRLAPTRRLALAGAALAIAVLAAVSLCRSPSPEPRKRIFVQIPYVVPPARYERTSVMRMNVPVAALIAAGFRIRSAGAGSSLPADVLMGQDGRALAVSLLLDTGEIYQ